MGAFFLIRNDDQAENQRVITRLETCLARQKLGEPRKIERPNYSLRLYGKMNGADESYVCEREKMFGFSTGTFIYKENVGRKALERFLRDFDPGNIEWNDIYGHFCVGIHKDEDFYLFTDRVGVYKAYCDSSQRVFSSSFLAVLESLEYPSVDSQAVYEYVFRGATYGMKTVIREIDLVHCDSITKISQNVALLPHPQSPRRPLFVRSWKDLQQANLSNARRYFQIIAKCFGNQIATALSGGYDSRLMLALLQEQGVRPYVYVYGKEPSDDVRVATDIAKKQSFAIHHIDKGQFQKVDIETFPDIVERNFFVFDGYPIDGIFDNGSDIATRLERSSGGRLVLNGGGGEIYRMFYPIANLGLTASQFVKRCYNDFDTSTCTSRFSAKDYRRAIADKVKCVSANGGGVLTRREIERLYVNFRCGYWMGRNNSLENRFSCSLTPFIDHHIVEDALDIPLKYKRHGRFEAAMIAEVSPSLASYPSDQGHDFVHGPSLGRKARNLTTIMYKTYLPLSAYRLKNRLRKYQRRVFPYYLKTDYIQSVMDPEFPYLSEYFHVDQITDIEHFARVCTLEYLFQKYEPSVP